ncbi:MAG TPA: substrate-binding and VWA domain-containing protein [Candidatus Dormibacteraeota bacterium]
MGTARRGPLAVASVFAVLLTGGLVSVSRLPAGCLTLVVASSQEKSTLLTQIAADYVRSHPAVDGQCVAIQVTRQASGSAEQALARGWDARTDGPRPDIWSPASTTWSVLLSDHLNARGKPNLVPDGTPILFKSPLVIGMPKPMAVALGWPDKALGWSDILQLARDRVGWGRYGHPDWGVFKLGKTNPMISTSGLHALIGTYFAASGRSSDLTEGALADPAVVDFVRGVEASVEHYGDSVSTFLLNLQAADDANRALSYVSAVAMEEKEVWDYNKGNPLADPTRTGEHAAPRVPLVAIYPKEGTIAADHPFVILRAPWVTDAKQRAAQAFLSFLHAPTQQLRFQAVGFRDQSGRPGPEISPSNGLQPEQPSAYLQPPAAPVIEAMQQAWTGLRKRARILVLLDVSRATSGADVRQLRNSLGAGLSELAPDDLVSCWEFASQLSGDLPYRQVLGFAPVATNASLMETRVATLQPTDRPAALYRAIRSGLDAVRNDADPTRINAMVVITNGRSTDTSDSDLSSLLRELLDASESSSVHVFLVAYGKSPDGRTLSQIARAARGATYDAGSPGGVFTAVISNF